MKRVGEVPDRRRPERECHLVEDPTMKRTRRSFQKIIIALAFVFLLPALGQAVPAGSYADLGALAADIAGSLWEKTGVMKLFLSRDNIKDALTGETANFSLYLAR